MPIATTIVGATIFMIVFGVQMVQTFAAHPEGDIEEGQALSLVMGMFGYMFLFVILPVLVSQIVMLVFFVTEGTRGPNRFGNDPKGRPGKAVADTFA